MSGSDQAALASGFDESDRQLKAPGHALPLDLRELEYVDGYDKNLMCPICHCPFIEGMRLPCDHTFCRQCVTRAFHSQQQDEKTCPSCRSVTRPEDFGPVPRFIGHMIDDLVVRCPKGDEGCKTTLRRSDIQYHANTDCAYAEIGCPSPDCKHRVARNLYGNICLHQIVQCNSCQTKMMQRDLRRHVEFECETKTWSCPDCNALVKAKGRCQHERECTEAVISCEASSTGCTFMDRRIAVQSHQRSCPMALMMPTLSRLSTRIDQQEASMNSLRHRNALLESGLESLKIELESTGPLTSLPRTDPLEQSGSAAAGETAVADAPFDSSTHHLLSLHETLREEVERVSGSVTELDARSSVMIMNENLRLKEDMAYLNAAVSSMRMQLHWLMSARLQTQQRLTPAGAAASSVASRAQPGSSAEQPSDPVRRLSDSTTKL